MLSLQFSCSNPVEWVARQFRFTGLRDARRSARVKRIAQAFATSPSKSIPQMFDRKADIDAAYEFFKRPETTPDAIQLGHRHGVAASAGEQGATTLLIEDSSEISWSRRNEVEGLGPVGSGKKQQQGFILHSVIAARWPSQSIDVEPAKRPPVEVLGLADQQYYVRKPRPADDPKSRGRRQGKRAVESQLWDRTPERLGHAPDGARLVRVGDRGADIFENIRDSQQAGYAFVFRACQDRVLVDEDGERAGKLFETLIARPALGRFEIDLRSRPGRKARVAVLEVASAPIRLRSPQRPGSPPGSRPPIACWGVRISEVDAPASVEGLEWFLLSDAPVESFAAAREIALQYSTRWLIEEFHKALKSGLRAESLQLSTADRLFAAISIMSLVALRLVDLREVVRATSASPASASGLSDLELRVLSVRLNRRLETVRDVALAIGRLGGHMNRKGDGLPGWQTLWRGMKDLQLLVEGVTLSQMVSEFRE